MYNSFISTVNLYGKLFKKYKYFNLTLVINTKPSTDVSLVLFTQTTLFQYFLQYNNFNYKCASRFVEKIKCGISTL